MTITDIVHKWRGEWNEALSDLENFEAAGIEIPTSKFHSLLSF